MKPTPNDQLLALLRRMRPAEAQNRLMRVADREIALSMMYTSDRDRELVLSLIAPSKAHRVREEFGFQRHLAVRHDQYLAAIRNVMDQLQREGGASPLRSYLRPRRGRRG